MPEKQTYERPSERVAHRFEDGRLKTAKELFEQAQYNKKE